MINELFTKFSDGRTPNQDDFNAGKMFLLLQDPFGTWCNYHAPKEEAVAEANLYENMRGKTDRSNRDVWIHEHCPKTYFISGIDEIERFKKTLQAMADGYDGIIGANLWDLRKKPGLWGGVNLLVKDTSAASVFGNYHYKIVQLKRAIDLKEHYAMQTALMNEVLSHIQGFNPVKALFVLKNREQSLDCSKIISTALSHVEDWQKIKDGSLVPDAKKPPKAALPPWRIFANKYLFEKKDLVLIPHLSGEMRAALRAKNINTYEDIINAGLAKIKEILKEPLASEELALATYAHAVAFKTGRPVLRSGPFPPAPKKRNLYFDFEATETFTAKSTSFIYLIGVWDREKDKFVSFVAKNEAEEENIFADFAAYAFADSNSSNGDTALYHWTEYEVKKMAALATKYPSIAPALNKLISACVDLKIVIEKAFYLPAPSLSLKAAAPAFGFKWRQTDCGAMDSMVYFTNWLKTGDNALLDKVLMYNEDDCKAMIFVEDYLKTAKAIKL